MPNIQNPPLPAYPDNPNLYPVAACTETEIDSVLRIVAQPEIHQLEIPSKIPVMTLPGAVLFPQVVMPLYIFEERYRKMLSDVLASTQIFGILTANDSDESLGKEAFHPMGSLGMVRTSQDNPDGTSNVLLQGLTRFTVSKIVEEEPYRIVEIEPISTVHDTASYEFLKHRVLALLEEKHKLGAKIPKDITNFLKALENDETFIELASFTAPNESSEKLELLQLLENSRRFERLIALLEEQVEDLKLFNKLRQGLRDEDIGFN